MYVLLQMVAIFPRLCYMRRKWCEPFEYCAAKIQVAPEVLQSFYGCGSPIPPDLKSCVVLDLGWFRFILTHFLMFEEAAVASILSLARLSLAKMDEFLELI
jgi:hypothetical protein